MISTKQNAFLYVCQKHIHQHTQLNILIRKYKICVYIFFIPIKIFIFNTTLSFLQRSVENQIFFINKVQLL